MGSKSRLIIPVFIPHGGCTHRCIFCNQNEITGKAGPPGPDEVRSFLSDRLGPDTPEAVIAFYGGSFTCLPRELQEAYLVAAGAFVEKRHASGIRLSTRPDCMDARVAGFLYSMGVLTVELGAQSMDDRVLSASARGHGAADTTRAANAVKDAGIELGVQIMAGLPGDTPEGFISSVREVALLGPAFVRIYPVLVVSGAPLERLYSRGEYNPLSLEGAVSLCADAFEIFTEAGIRVVRTGLQPSAELERSVVAGPYHPAFGHLVGSEAALRTMAGLIEASEVSTGRAAIELRVNPSELSRFLGINKSNIGALEDMFGLPVSISADAAVGVGCVALY